MAKGWWWMTITVQSEGIGVRRVGLMRRIAIGGLAGGIAGVVVLGVGARLVMFVSRLLHPEAVGLITENNNRIGQFTIGGTLELILLGGVGFGLTAGVVWVIVRKWMPDSAVLVGLGAVAIGGSLLIQADNTDFFLLQGPQIDIVLLLGLILVFGMSVYWVDGWLDRRLPDHPGRFGVVVYSIMLIVGVVFLFAVFGAFFLGAFCLCSNSPRWTGVFLAATLLTTVAWWVQHLRGAEEPTNALKTVGTTSVVLTGLAGAIHLTREIIHIL